MFKSLSIEHYRGFSEKQSIEFAMPHQDGSGLNIIIGPNNVGKTTILEALLMDGNKKLNDSELHHGNEAIITITIPGSGNFNDTRLEYRSNMRGRQQSSFLKPTIIPSNYYPKHSSKNDLIINNNIDTLQDELRKQNLREAIPINLIRLLKTIHDSEGWKKQFNDFVRKIFPDFGDWDIGYEHDEYNLKYKNNQNQHSSLYLGDGVISILFICATLAQAPKPGVILIDQPEKCLHPAAQKALSNILSTISKDYQIIVCTHSNYFVNWSDLVNGAKYIRLNNYDGRCTPHHLNYKTLDCKTLIENASKVKDYQRPQFLGLIAKEILFYDKILFVEGQEDVGLIKQWVRDNNIILDFDIFEYGVGGYNNMRKFLSLAKDLGIRKVAALYDNGKEATKRFNEDKALFIESGYHFFQLETEDIRDKPKHSCEHCKHDKIIGCFDESGKIKEEYKDHFKKIIDGIIDYFAISSADKV